MESKEMDFREKRLTLTFKIIYVIAIFFGALVLTMNQEISDAYIIIACTAAFLLTILLYMVIYVCNEMKCLNLNDNKNDWQIQITEKCYSNLYFLIIKTSGFTAIGCFILNCILFHTETISNLYLLIMFCIGFEIWKIIACVQHKYPKGVEDHKIKNIKLNDILNTIKCSLITIMFHSVFIYIGIAH